MAKVVTRFLIDDFLSNITAPVRSVAQNDKNYNEDKV